ncbi:MAG: hypothetical protein ASARMPRED_001717 [Alectoria sarmentosa]|nr:MAG: hypothetical protein ASARMPRED_001717 [Alectoria sarmentosa]
MQILWQFLAVFGTWIIYLSWTVLTRLFFHRLSRFPGPKLAAATKWYECYFDLLKWPGGTFMYEIERMHDVYGPIVRINPEELHVRDSEWVGILYTGPANGIRDKYPPAAHMTGTPYGVFGTIDHEVHRKRRAAISPFFSKNTVNSAQPTIYKNMNLLGQTLRQSLANGGVVEMRKTYLAMTTDTLSDHTFGESLDLLQEDAKADEWKRTIKAVAVLTPLIKQFTWIIPLALRLPLSPLQMVVPDLARIVALRRDMYTKANRAIRDSQNDLRSKSIESLDGTTARSTNVFESILASKVLPTKEKEANRIAQEGFVVLVAGGETTARVLTTATFHILAKKETVLLRLKEELATVMVDPDTQVDVKTLEQLPWLTAVIKESLRITALVTSRLPLVSPQEPLKYGDWDIPPGTPISMTLRDVLLDPSMFVNPLEFLPERWLSHSPDLERINQAYVPFGRGSRMCVGLNFALAELYIVIACLFRRFDLQLHDTTRERDIDYSRDCFIGESSPESIGVRVKAAAATVSDMAKDTV